MAKGRKTGGRRKGSRNKVTIATEMAVAATGRTPKEVMLDNMRFFDQQAAQLLQQIVAKTTEPGVDLGVALGEMLKFRQMAVECAQKVAPYCHPRLNAVMVADERPGLLSANGRRLEDLTEDELRSEILQEMVELGLLPPGYEIRHLDQDDRATGTKGSLRSTNGGDCRVTMVHGVAGGERSCSHPNLPERKEKTFQNGSIPER